MRARKPVVIRHDRPPQNRLHAQHIEIIAGDELAFQPLVLSVVAEAEGKRITAHHAAEHLALITKVLVHRIGEGSVTGIRAVVRSLPAELHELLGMLDWEQSQEHLIEQSEDCRIGADAQCQ